MKTIKIIHYHKPKIGNIAKENYYSVSLGNGYKQHFLSEKNTLAFLAQTNKFLNLKLNELNFVYADVLKIYRGSWIYFDKINVRSSEYYCNEKFEQINRSFNLCVERSTWENGNVFVFNHLNSVINELSDVCHTLIGFYRKRGLTANIYECESFLQRLLYIKTAIKIYPGQIQLLEKQQEPFHLKIVI